MTTIMKVVLVLVFGADMAAAQAADTASLPPLQTPGLVLAAEALDLGEIIPGQRATGALTLRNARVDGPLAIRLVRTSSPQLSARLSATRLAAGEQTQLQVEYRSEVSDDGPFTEQIILYPDDPARPVVKVRVQGVRRAPITWNPKLLMLGIRRDMPLDLPQLRIDLSGRSALSPPRVTSFVPYLGAAIHPSPGDSYTIQLQVDPAMPLGQIAGWLRIETGHPTLPVLDVPVVGQALGSLVPQPLSFGFVEEGQPVIAETVVSNIGGAQIHIVRAEPSLPTEAKVELNTKGKDYLVRVHLSAPRGPQSLNGHINLYTDRPAEPLVQVPVAGMVWVRKPFERGADENSLYSLVKAALFEDPKKLSGQDILRKIFGGVRDDRVVSLVLRGLKDDNWAVRMRAAEILGLLGSKHAIEPVRKAVTHDIDEDVRRTAAAALYRMVGREAFPDLLLALEDNDDWVRADAARLLGELGDGRAIPPLTRALSDEGTETRISVQEALNKIAGTDNQEQEGIGYRIN